MVASFRAGDVLERVEKTDIIAHWKIANIFGTAQDGRKKCNELKKDTAVAQSIGDAFSGVRRPWRSEWAKRTFLHIEKLLITSERNEFDGKQALKLNTKPTSRYWQVTLFPV